MRSQQPDTERRSIFPSQSFINVGASAKNLPVSHKKISLFEIQQLFDILFADDVHAKSTDSKSV